MLVISQKHSCQSLKNHLAMMKPIAVRLDWFFVTRDKVRRMLMILA